MNIKVTLHCGCVYHTIPYMVLGLEKSASIQDVADAATITDCPDCAAREQQQRKWDEDYAKMAARTKERNIQERAFDLAAAYFKGAPFDERRLLDKTKEYADSLRG